MDVLHAPLPPVLSLSPARDRVVFIKPLRYPPIADLAQPMLGLAGVRINPATSGPHRAPRVVSMTLRSLDGGNESPVAIPNDATFGYPHWSPDGRQFALLRTLADRIELWLVDAATGAARPVANLRVNAAFSTPLDWMGDSKTLLVHMVPSSRGEPPVAAPTPIAPVTLETTGDARPVRTYPDLLKNSFDEQLFDHYATSQLALLDTVQQTVQPIGEPGIFLHVEPSPDDQHLLVLRIERPYSYLHPASRFPRSIEVWSRMGQIEHVLARLPLADRVPIEGVPLGPRSIRWRPTKPATLVWTEALDEGDPRRPAEFRDRLFQSAFPFTESPVPIVDLPQRFAGLVWAEHEGLALVSDYDRDRRWTTTRIVSFDQPQSSPRLLWDRSVHDRYGDPGRPILRRLPNGQRVLWQDGSSIFLDGAGSTPEGDRPFLDRLDLESLATERIFHSRPEQYETFVAMVSAEGPTYITRRESPTDPPNFFLYRGGQEVAKLTDFPDPAPQLRAITKQLVTYERDDGVPLSFTLYLPPNWQPGTRLPTVLWAYPREFTDASTAGQVAGSPNRFTTISGASHLFFLLEGYAVLDGAALPVIGDPETVNNTYVEQTIRGAQAALQKAHDMGIADLSRVAVGGHSYGAFMTANLLAHSRLFRAGIARSGAYNRTLTPFGFQSERRTLWECPEAYWRLSPFMYAHQIRDPLLLIHGAVDDNPGTFPVQSERMYQAIHGNGGTARLVMLPFESHGYEARESIEHTLYEMLAWLDRYVKNAQPREDDAVLKRDAGPST